jgi:hypothetical protein
MSTQANAAILGLVSPSLELSIESKFVGVIPYSLLNLFDSQLSVGVSLKPTYKLEYRLQETILEIIENSKSLGIYNRAQEGVGLGLDFGFILHKVYEADELKVGGRITNLGDTAYKSRQIITKQKNQEPSKDKAGLNLGSSYLLNLTQDESIELAFAVMVNNVLTPQQSNALSLGSTLNFFNKKFKIYLGHNHDDRSIGFKVCFKKVNLIYGYINEHGGNLTSKERHLIQIQYFVS